VKVTGRNPREEWPPPCAVWNGAESRSDSFEPRGRSVCTPSRAQGGLLESREYVSHIFSEFLRENMSIWGFAPAFAPSGLLCPSRGRPPCGAPRTKGHCYPGHGSFTALSMDSGRGRLRLPLASFPGRSPPRTEAGIKGSPDPSPWNPPAPVYHASNRGGGLAVVLIGKRNPYQSHFPESLREIRFAWEPCSHGGALRAELKAHANSHRVFMLLP
jgi:hypothetical protein